MFKIEFCCVLLLSTDELYYFFRLLEFVGENPELPDDNWVAAPVKPGSLVLIHGQVRV
jgi:hypothetical protein